ncbi:hypothetical protein ILUMI_12342 [Ignelater luminosus]|uniref:TIL domain-containing protein n=1 Tax=Ignelater luminosus TaxID=2038154 RepID=A0A8K0CWN2_IGNLU|nr:hypothetical protein ILUMI_12342 [Ignelater luminosus]
MTLGRFEIYRINSHRFAYKSRCTWRLSLVEARRSTIKMRSSLYALVFFFVVAAAFGKPQGGNRCGKNEVYSDCHPHPSCQLTCDNYQNPPQICPAVCSIGCACQPNFVRNSSGSCVPRNQCRRSY